ncbi:NADH dehydrogenase [ubiquinone] flavoprotein 3, mitochondrial-like [Ischnura elegans]|uniref:NADH dehydrogenase [ubiquinone] flavoprotein 3, mitochondrial-like n=1 Tax=Ischnura elegans TaxID=197161 RepID=UPI001ED881BA|nr:NADH dehydrogenase [ubiquinone] flavoprotein 3, mitochondrial-like [Ischnura elegans]
MRLHAVIKLVSRSVGTRKLCTKVTTGGNVPKPPPKPASSSGSGGANIASVAGVSSNVMNVPNTEVGPGASKNSAYKNPEYYSYHPFSYAEAEVEMLKFRLPQPSSKKSQ